MVKAGGQGQKGLQNARNAANTAAIELMNTLKIGDELTDEQRATLAAYSGEGGIVGDSQIGDGTGKMYEYYTPAHVAQGMADLLAAYGVSGNGLEPSAGTGVFNEHKPASTIMTAAELSPVSARINQLLHPEDKVHSGAFELLARNTPDDTFDFSIGNVPFGDARETASLDEEYRDEQNLGRYFIHRMIDKTRPNGLVCVIVPHGMTSGAQKKFRADISRKAEFLGAHRLNSDTFQNSNTNTVTDVWVLKKHPAEAVDRIANATRSQLEEANILWNTFIDGKWFERDGKRFVYGEEKTTGSGMNTRKVVESDGKTNAQLREALAKRFESRIDWGLLELTTVQTEPHLYAEGDRRVINGRWHTMTYGEWIAELIRDEQALDVATFGAETFEALRSTIATRNGLLTLTMEQINNIHQQYPSLFENDPRLIESLQFASKQTKVDRERIFRGSLIGHSIADLSACVALHGNDSDRANGMRLTLRELVSAENARYGNTATDKKLTKLIHAPWLAFTTATNADGSLSDLLLDGIEVKVDEELDTASPIAVVNYLQTKQINGGAIPLDEFKALCTVYRGATSDADFFHQLLTNHPELAVTSDGSITTFDRAVCGNITQSQQSIYRALSNEHLPLAVKNSLNLQLAEIEKRRTRTSADKITFQMSARWLDRSLVAEFLMSEGYDKIRYVKNEDILDGTLIAEDYSGKDGIFTGYTRDTVVEKGTGLLAFKDVTRSDENFERQLEKYLNGKKARSNTREMTVVYNERIADLEARFDTFIRQHPDFEQVVEQYNSTFNGYIPFEHSDAPLNLKEISGNRVPFNFQNAGVRRLSEDGRGILGFGTGMGKTTTALALEAYNYENGRSTRTAIVVPKAVLENWYHEAREFYSKDAFKKILFVGLDTVTDQDGNIQQVPVLDEEGNQVINKHTNQVSMRDSVKISDSATIKARMHSVPHSNWRTVVMTKEQYAALPLREDTIESVARDNVNHFANGGLVKLDAKNHSQASKLARVKAEAADTGSKKDSEYPYFEDMEFDSVIVDEGHNYRNSYGLGHELGQLAYLPSPAIADCARDMAFKNTYLMKKHNGRGSVLLTATPTVNSPVDAFNMLSHVIEKEEWERLGIYSPDDFIRTFGEISTVVKSTLSGDAVSTDGLVGFKNLDGLRAIFHRMVNLKKPEDVGKEAVIPDLEEVNVEAPMSDEQTELYENLRWRAKWSTMSDLEQSIAMGEGKQPPVNSDGQFIEEDETFKIIRDMDRVGSDLDLYYKRMTFVFPLSEKSKVEALAATLPESAVDGKDEEENTRRVDTTVSVQDKRVTLVVHESLESKVLAGIKKHKINGTSHPVTPKFAAMLANLKAHLNAGGKQIIFTDEKSLHGKLSRLIAEHLGIGEHEIGIINATSVAANKPKNAPKVPKAPKGAEDNPKYADDWAQYYADLDAYELAQGTIELAGLEGIAADYNEGRTRIVICNKKAEVGINLHKGTTAIHHLTLPWTPASVAQRNGRGARVGAKQKKVDVYYYCGKGSFDEYRLATLKRKAAWINELFTSNEARMRNADMDDADEAAMLLADNDAERQTKEQAAKAALAEKLRAQQVKTATDAVAQYISAMRHSSTDPEQAELRLARLREKANETKAELEEMEQKIAAFDQAQAEADLADRRPRSDISWELKRRKELLDKLTRQRRSLAYHEKSFKLISQSANTLKRLKPQIEAALEKGLLDVDGELLTDPDKFLVLGSTLIKLGSYLKERYWINKQGQRQNERGMVYKLTGFDRESGEVTLTAVNKNFNGNIEDFVRVGDKITITASQFEQRYYVVSFTENELARITHLANREVTPLQALDTFERDEILQLAESGKLEIKSALYLAYDSAGDVVFTQMRGYNRTSTELLLTSYCRVTRADRLIAQKAAKLIELDRLHAKSGSSSPCNEQMTALFGSQWRRSYVDYLEQGSPEEIAQFVADHIKTMESNILTEGYQGQLESQYIYNGQFSGLARPEGLSGAEITLVKVEYPPAANKSDYEKALRTATFKLFDDLIKAAEVGAGAKLDAMYNHYKKAINAPDAEIRERVSLLNDINYNWNVYGASKEVAADSPYAGLHLYDTKMVAAYGGSQLVNKKEATVVTPNFAQALADLVTLECLSASDIDEGSMEFHVANALIKTGLDKFRALELDRRAKEAAESAFEDTPEPMRDTGEATAKAASAQLTLVPVTTTTKCYGHKTFKGGDAWAIYDPAGVGGRLHTAREKLKEKYDAKYFNGNKADRTHELHGKSWWVVSNKHDISAVMSTITN
ncbi:MAG: SNF2-related protein [Plesiomonas shigelloides]